MKRINLSGGTDMNCRSTGRLFCAALLVALAAPAAAKAQEAQVVRSTENAALGKAPTGDELTAQDREVLAWTNQLAAEASQIIERWIASKAVSEERLFSHMYFPIPQRDPPKYSTEYDALADRDFQAPEEKTLGRSSSLVYSIVSDVNGYVPTHNERYSAPLTGNRVLDLVNNRTKRIFGDRTGFLAGRNEQPYLMQRYKRDTGEVLFDMSVPIMVRGKHFGCVRVGYRRDDR